MDRLKEGLPPVAQGDSPVLALGGCIHVSPLPVREAALTHGHEPALRVAAAEGVDVDGHDRLQGAVLGEANLQGQGQHHVHQPRLVLVALEGEQHVLPPGGVEPAAQTHVVADEDGVHLDAAVPLLQQVLQLQVLQVRLQPQKVLQGLSHLWAARPLGEHVARVAAPASGAVVRGAVGTGGPFAQGTGDGALAGSLLVGAGAAVALFQEGAGEGALPTVEEGLDTVPPVGQGPVGGETEMKQESQEATHCCLPEGARRLTNREADEADKSPRFSE